MTGWLVCWLATLSSGFTGRHSEERKKEGKKVAMAVEEGAVFLTQVSSARVSPHICIFLKIGLILWFLLLTLSEVDFRLLVVQRTTGTVLVLWRSCELGCACVWTLKVSWSCALRWWEIEACMFVWGFDPAWQYYTVPCLLTGLISWPWSE